MENKDCCDDCRGSNATLNESGTSIVWYCTNSSCPCHSKTPEKDETIIPNREKQPLPKPNKLDKIFSIEASTDEGWEKEFEIVTNDIFEPIKEEDWFKYAQRALKRYLQKEREKTLSDQAAFKHGKSEAFRLVKEAIEESRIKHNHSNRCKIDEPYCIQKEKEVEYTNDVLFSISSKLSTLEGK